MGKVYEFSDGMSRGYLVTDKKNIVVDCGCDVTGKALKAVCEEAGITPEDIGLIVITHEHVDHFIGADTFKKLTGAPILCAKDTVPSLTEGLEPDVTPRDASIKKPGTEGEPKPDFGEIPHVTPDIVIYSEFDLNPYGIGGKLILTPGHSDGSLSVLLDWNEAIVGDLIMSDEQTGEFRQAIFANCEEALSQSIHTLIYSGAQTFYSGHSGPCPLETLKDIYPECV